MPKISFVLPTHQRIAWVPRCIESLQDQTEKDIEIIVVNDNGDRDDGTKDFLDEYSKTDPRIIVIHNEKNLGAGKSRNIGTERASAPIICVCDDDDVYVEDRAEVTLRWFSEHPESEMVTFPYMRIGYFEENLEAFWGTEFDHEAFKKDGTIGYFSNPSAAFRKESSLAMGGYPSETKNMTDDHQFVTNWVNSGRKIDFDKRAMVCLHRVMPNSMMVGLRGWKKEWVGQ